jgi:hypothetical protein
VSLVTAWDGFIAGVRAEMDRRDPGHRHTWVMVTDGGGALQPRVATNFNGVTLVLDLLYVMKEPWKLAHAVPRRHPRKPLPLPASELHVSSRAGSARL